MSELLHLGLANVVMATVLAGLAVAVGSWARRPALSHGLWLLVLVKLITPPLIAIPIPWGSSEPEVVAAASPVEVTLQRLPDPKPEPPPVTVTLWIPTDPEAPPLQRPMFFQTAPGQNALVVDQDNGRAMRVYEGRVIQGAALPHTRPVFTREAPPPPVVETPPGAAAPAPSLWLLTLPWLWVAGSVLWFGCAAYHLVRFQRLLRHAQPAAAALQQTATTLSTRMGLRRCPAVWLVPGKLPPMVWMGLCRPRILFPRELLNRIGEEECAALLAHELAHIHRGDHWVRWLEMLVAGLYWWLPLVWWGSKQLRAREEECCDAWVVGELSPRSYATAILRTLDFLAEAPTALPVGATGLTTMNDLKQRLTLIMEQRTPKQMSSLSCASVLLLGLLLLPLLPQLVRPELPTAPESAYAAQRESSAPPQDVLWVAGSRIDARPTVSFIVVEPKNQLVLPTTNVNPLAGKPAEANNPEAGDRLWQLRLRKLTEPDEDGSDE